MSLPSWEKIIDPNFINAELIGEEGAEKVVTIKDIDMAECYDEQTKSKIQKQTVFFEECKPMVLNKTNAKTLKKLFSPNSDNPADAFGHRVILKVEKVKAFGKITTGIRIKEFSEEKCPICGNVIQGTGEAVVSCCGIVLPALEAEPEDDEDSDEEEDKSI